MTIRGVFNILLLALSLTTLVITLVSYIIFRFRYSLQQKHNTELHHLTGTYFNRFAPHLRVENEKNAEVLTQKVERREIWRSRPIVFFGFVGAVIFSLLTLEHYFVFRKDLSKRSLAASEYRALLSQGLLQTKPYDPTKAFNPAESFSEASSERKAVLTREMSARTLQIFSPVEGARSPLHARAKILWEKWLAARELKSQVITQCADLGTQRVTLAPSLGDLDPTTRECLTKYMTSGGTVYFTGKTDGKILTSEFALQTNPNPDARQNFPTLFKSSSKLAWDIPPGLRLSWFPLDNEFIYTSGGLDSDADQAQFNATPSKNLLLRPVRFISSERSTHRALWSALDPVVGASDQTYVDSILLSALAWSARLPVSKIADWKDGQPIASVIAVDSEDHFSNLEKLAKMIKKVGQPVTTFLVSDLFLENLEVLETLDEKDDLGSHTDNHKNLEAYTPEQNFNRLQKSRLDIEENWKHRVTGFRPPEESYNAESLKVAEESGYSYIFADQNPSRLSPVFVNQGSLLLYPRVLDDDVLIRRNRLLSTPAEIASHMLTQYDYARIYGGAYLFSLHTHIVGEDPVLESGFEIFLGKMAKFPAWKTTFRDLSDWWKTRDALVSEVALRNGALNGRKTITLKVKNTGKQDATGVVVRVSPPGIGESGRLVPTTGRNPASTETSCSGGVCLVAVPTVPAETTVEYDFDIATAD